MSDVELLMVGSIAMFGPGTLPNAIINVWSTRLIQSATVGQWLG
jgi:hypothetical protein